MTTPAPHHAHRGTVAHYSQATPSGITGAWACSCGTSGTSVDPDAALAAHHLRLCGEASS